MPYTKVNYEEVEPVASGMHFLREELDAENLGLTVIDVEAGWTGKEHDHADEGDEEVYYLVDGEATIVVDGEEVALSSGDAVRVAGDATRQLTAGTDATFVVVGAP